MDAAGGMPVAFDRGLIQLRVRPDTVYASHGSTVFATDLDGFLHDGIEHGLFVEQTRLLSRYRCLVDDQPLLPVTLSNVGQDSWLGYYLVPSPGGGHHADLVAPEDSAQHAVEVRISRVVGDGMHEDVDLENFSQQPVTLRLALEIDADFADQDETRRGRL